MSRFFYLFLTIALIFTSSMFAAEGKSVREYVNFDKDWLFARFGPMPDGSCKIEPGASIRVFTTKVSSAEPGNPGLNAVDEDVSTRWCAADGTLPQSFTVDMSETYEVEKLKITWEKASNYRYKVEGSIDGENWRMLADKTEKQASNAVDEIETSGTLRHIRITVAGLDEGSWASIREMAILGSDGRQIENKAEPAGKTPSMIDYDDSSWRKLHVPHDWGIEGPFRSDLENDTAKLPWKAIGWYRKHFTVGRPDKGKRIFIDFDGAMANSKVWLNGKDIGGWPYGYNSFRLELTDHLNWGGENVLAVNLDTANWGSRWYPGAGIYRHVRLVKTAPVHVGHWGVFVTTPTITDSEAAVNAQVELANQAGIEKSAICSGVIYELDSEGNAGKAVASCEPAVVTLDANSSGKVALTGNVTSPKLWDITSPNRYLLRTTVKVDGEVVDSYDTKFGFRTIKFTARDGFYLNGRRVEIRGVCNHHDLGPLGAAVNTRAMERQIELLQEMGCNAIRTAHNMPAPELAELCDKMGVLLQVEAFDCWQGGKRANDYSSIYDEWYEKDLRAMVKRDRSSPSVFMWSTGNEVPDQDNPEMGRHLTSIIHDEDATRPVTVGCNWGRAGFNGFQKAVDAFGYNYRLQFYDQFLNDPQNADVPLYGSETASCVSSRGEYFFPVERENAQTSEANADFQVSAYGLQAPGWGNTPDEQFTMLDKYPAVFGEFVWTGFDYLGEPTPYNNDATNLLNFSDPAKKAELQRQLDRLGKIEVPSRSSYFGIFDLCGFKKDRFYIYQARWKPDLPMAHILPHWNWPERIGEVTPVHVYTSGDEAELFLNGKSLGRRKIGEYEYRLRWDDVVYEPGKLEVVAYKDGKEWARDVVETTGSAVGVEMTADRDTIKADGYDLSFVTVRIVDKHGRLVPRSHNLVKFKVDGPGQIVAVGNGNAASHEPFQASKRKAFNGMCLAIVRAEEGKAGQIQLKASAEELEPAQILIRAE